MEQPYIELLQKLIATPSFSGEEEQTALHIRGFLEEREVLLQQEKYNIWAQNLHFDPQKPTVLLNSHHDTVRPNKGYTRDPFLPEIQDGKLFGLGSNDAGASLVCLMALFLHFYRQPDLKYNLILAATAEEENSGSNGIRRLLPKLPQLDFALVGEPTQMHMAIAEKGLLVIDGYAKGKAGHAAHENTENAIYKALEDIEWLRNYRFAKKSDLLGAVKVSVTQIEAGSQHNVVPADCHFVIDVRVNEHYSNHEVFELLSRNTTSRLKARSFRHNSSAISPQHPIVKAGKKLGSSTYGSPTLSDQAALSCPSLKMGPGDSLRSHQADEFIFLSEIREGIQTYIRLFEQIL